MVSLSVGDVDVVDIPDERWPILFLMAPVRRPLLSLRTARRSCREYALDWLNQAQCPRTSSLRPFLGFAIADCSMCSGEDGIARRLLPNVDRRFASSSFWLFSIVLKTLPWARILGYALIPDLFFRPLKGSATCCRKHRHRARLPRRCDWATCA